MSPLIYYKCAKCKITHNSYEEAEMCEKGHLSAVTVKELQYVMGAYPYRIALVFPDGKERAYTADDGYFFGNEVNHTNNGCCAGNEVKHANNQDKGERKGHQSP